MSPRWNWDFEDERKARRLPAPAPEPALAPSLAASPPDARRTQIRRRRGAAAVVLIALVVLVVVLASSSDRGRAGPATGARAQVAVKRPPSDTENDQRAAVASVLAYTPFVKTAGTRAREIALTFDDGPGPYTPAVLSVLERMHVPATFFVIGKMLRYFSAAAVREIQDGDVIGDHTESHPMLATLSAHDQYEELFEQIARVELLGGRRPTLFRPPYGSFNANTMRELSRLHLLMVLWSVDTEDYRQPGVSVIVERALAGAQPGAILLMHDAGGAREQTIAALPLVIRGLRARGFRLVTVPQLMLDDPPPAGQPLPPNLSGD
ncbi:MAG TPA: polysaccharide deacetylase family protein [Solirubrobacteraceae bacterium]|jgi:peptidoglycan/xylan/chitin deacetylase (PgdA/CDA1 family)